MKYYVQIEIDVDDATTPEQAASIALDTIQNEEVTLIVGTKTGTQEEHVINSWDISQEI